MTFWNKDDKEQERLHKELDQILAKQGKYVGGLDIRQIKTPAMEIDIYESERGGKNLVFLRGTYSFYPNCAVAVGWYLDSNEMGSEPFFVDLARENIREPNLEWREYFFDTIENAIDCGNPPTGIYFLYENGKHPALPED